jgi:uncharacterized protein YfkK (UPF0435 family)
LRMPSFTTSVVLKTVLPVSKIEEIEKLLQIMNVVVVDSLHIRNEWLHD